MNECCEPTVQTAAPVCAAEAETFVGTHLAVENVALECEAVGQYAGKVECVEGQHITLECVQPAVCGSPEHGMSGDVGDRLEVLHPGAGFINWILISLSASQELWGRA